MKLKAQIYDKDQAVTAAVDLNVLGDRYISAISLGSLKIPQTIPPPECVGDMVPLRGYDPGYKNTTVCNYF